MPKSVAACVAAANLLFGHASSDYNFEYYFPLLLDGAWVTVYLIGLRMAVAVLLGLPVALTRLYAPMPFRWLATGYVEFFRGIPVLLLLYFLYYGLPSVG